ncbi:flagellar biosynthesis protein FlgF [Gilliamella sp. Choc4-2]|jgi:flagellar basal-body rod protein FlgF|uniref:flagellar basal body rod protein FlgF n=1 Tax=unclassified Gilliamella TaxID=2685620 RepID=UPI00080E5893|nr:flagellar basal body rod protein FlgF [Gilliamella apicola]OCG31047.1 flagellar biosynthesis protein FlgF [Gilliamella apicola]OCG46615.1 flagellar biosynthesis protein FlgF [Gilliamella apicola]OCG55898.1 flagellar biosynthesis protein FlgF [Gilliamella apicola]OCG64783.1 flagellar biosynthesis protein FlgF [Gilliamella apicola]
MDRVIYTAMSGASQTLSQQSITTHNLANVTTTGFRAQLTAMKAVPIVGNSMQTRTMVTATTPSFDSTMGAFNYTGRNLDVALSENDWLAIQLADGSEAYTRNGAIQIDENGTLNIQGYPLIGDNGVLTVPQRSQVSISSDGTLSALGAGDKPTTIAQAGKIKKVHLEHNEIIRGDNGFFQLTEETRNARGAVLQDNPNAKLMSGVLEGSNVNPVTSMIDLISHSRQFEMQIKEITTADENAQKANQILSLT